MRLHVLYPVDQSRSYICSKNVHNYEHFGDPNKGRCALHDNVEDVHEQAVKRAADEAMAKVKAENPELSEADLMIQVSDRVKRAEAARKGRAAERLNEFPFEMLADQLVHRPGFPRVPPLPGAGAEPPRYVDDFPPNYELFGRGSPLPEESEEQDHQVIRGPHPAYAEPDPFYHPYPRRHPTPVPFHNPPGRGFVYNDNIMMFTHIRERLIFNPWDNILFDPRTMVGQDMHTGEVFPVLPPIYRNPAQRFDLRHHPNDRY